MLELARDLPNNVSLLVHELPFFLSANAIRQGEQTREGVEGARERRVGMQHEEED